MMDIEAHLARLNAGEPMPFHGDFNWHPDGVIREVAPGHFEVFICGPHDGPAESSIRVRAESAVEAGAVLDTIVSCFKGMRHTADALLILSIFENELECELEAELAVDDVKSVVEAMGGLALGKRAALLPREPETKEDDLEALPQTEAEALRAFDMGEKWNGTAWAHDGAIRSIGRDLFEVHIYGQSDGHSPIWASVSVQARTASGTAHLLRRIVDALNKNHPVSAPAEASRS